MCAYYFVLLKYGKHYEISVQVKLKNIYDKSSTTNSYLSSVPISIGPSIYYFNISSDYSDYVGFMKKIYKNRHESTHL